MFEYALLRKEAYLADDDNPYRVLNLMLSAGVPVNVKKTPITFMQFEAKLKDGKFLYVNTSLYHGWKYTVAITTEELPFVDDVGYETKQFIKLQDINSEQFYDFFKKLYEENQY